MTLEHFPSRAGARPLYAQIRDVLVQRIAGGIWHPGDMLPSEIRIAEELGVSQGTVRKALDWMTAEHLLVRRQGKGTFVATYDEARVLFQFFKLKADQGETPYPVGVLRGMKKGTATADERAQLDLGRDAPVWRVERLRRYGETIIAFERITLPAERFAGIETGPFPQNLYAAYAERFAIAVAGGEERMKAVAASPAEAGVFAMAPGAPLLAVERLTLAVDGMPVEWRVSLYRTDRWHYACALS